MKGPVGRWAWGPVLTGLAVVGCGGEALAPEVVVRDAYAFEAKEGGTAAAYAVIVNGTDSTETLDSIVSMAGFVSMHTQTESNGMVSMVSIERPTIPAHDSLVFAPGVRHLMLEGYLHDLVPGDSIDLTFWFARRGDVRTIAVVRPYGR
jgi:copper(I)-binding protein